MSNALANTAFWAIVGLGILALAGAMLMAWREARRKRKFMRRMGL